MFGSKNFLELPLIVMDTALFNRKRMGLDEEHGLRLIKQLIKSITTFGGVLSINWHTRSLNPERNWDEFYISLIHLLSAENVWFASTNEVVDWFEMRRKVHFLNDPFDAQSTNVCLNSVNPDGLPKLQINYYIPKGKPFRPPALDSVVQKFISFPGGDFSETDPAV
jgi:hypothetical protein